MKRAGRSFVVLLYFAVAAGALAFQKADEGQVIAAYRSWTSFTTTMQLVRNPIGVGL